jgi:hypothetical protein
MTKPGPRNEVQCMRRDGAVAHYAFDTEEHLKRIWDDVAAFYFGREHPPQDKEDLEIKDAKQGF